MDILCTQDVPLQYFTRLIGGYRKELRKTSTLTIRLEVVEIREIASKTRTRRDTELRYRTISNVYRFNAYTILDSKS